MIFGVILALPDKAAVPPPDAGAMAVMVIALIIYVLSLFWEDFKEMIRGLSKSVHQLKGASCQLKNLERSGAAYPDACLGLPYLHAFEFQGMPVRILSSVTLRDPENFLGDRYQQTNCGDCGNPLEEVPIRIAATGEGRTYVKPILHCSHCDPPPPEVAQMWISCEGRPVFLG